jgi:hypothetical protein
MTGSAAPHAAAHIAAEKKGGAMRPRTGIWILGAASLALAGLALGSRHRATPGTAGAAPTETAPADTETPLVILDTRAMPGPRPAPAVAAGSARGPHWDIEERVRQAAGDRAVRLTDIRVTGYRGQFACGAMQRADGSPARRFVWVADAGKLLVEGEADDYAQLAPLCLARPG